MLQPAELGDVSLRFAGQIAALRRFFLQAAIPLDSAEATRELAHRVVEDRAFHRDLMSHIWVLLDEGGPSLGYADLLRITAIAARGVRGAAETDEADAHTLLRFLMEAKHTLEGPPAPTEIPSPSSAGPKPLEPASSLAQRSRSSGSATSAARRMPARSPGISTTHEQQHLRRKNEAEENPSTKPPKRRTFLYTSAAVCAVTALVLLFLILNRRSDGNNSIASNTDPAALSGTEPAVSPTREKPQSKPTANLSPAAEPSGQPLHDRSTSRLATLSPRAGGSASTDYTSPYRSPTPALTTAAPDPAPPLPRPGMAPATPVLPSVPASQPNVVIARPPKPGALPVPINPDTLTRRLDSPRLPAYAYDPEDAGRKRYPHLLRRHPSDPTGDGATTLSAELRAPDLAGSSYSRNAAPAPAVHGTVHSTSLGMMAGNLVYGPAPSYPPAAAAARIQGEVKIQATIDRDGTVGAARVVSGPPLLRDAAVDAVQHWRYKPFLSAGKPTPTGTMAVVEFELQ